MHTFLKISFVGLLLVLLVAIGTEVTALLHVAPAAGPRGALLVVRKAPRVGTPAKTVRPVLPALHGTAPQHHPKKTRPVKLVGFFLG